MKKMRCALSEVECKLCELNHNCPIYTKHYVLKGELKKLKANLENALVVVKAILESERVGVTENTP